MLLDENYKLGISKIYRIFQEHVKVFYLH